jgi:hypothetical protein
MCPLDYWNFGGILMAKREKNSYPTVWLAVFKELAR